MAAVLALAVHHSVVERLAVAIFLTAQVMGHWIQTEESDQRVELAHTVLGRYKCRWINVGERSDEYINERVERYMRVPYLERRARQAPPMDTDQSECCVGRLRGS